MILDGVSLLIYGKTAYVQDLYSEEEVRLNVRISTLHFLRERGVDRLSYDSGEQYILIEDILDSYSGGAI